MESTKNKVIVPYDFTEIANHAIEHAVNFSKVLNASIALLHIVKKDAPADEATKKLEEVAQEYSSKFSTQVDAFVREGTIFKTISEASDELNAVLVVMGTHGMKGLQKLTGSWALKVIVGSRVPFIVIQAPPKHKDISNIVFPVDFKSENKEKLKWVEFVARYLKTKIYLLSSANKDGAVDSRTKANVVFSKKFLDEKKINYELAIAEGGSSFSQETINFAKKIDADIIIAMTTRDIAFHDYVLGAQEQHIIANEHKIPVLVVNPRTDLMKYGYGGFN
ncbi:MAG: universal stress protein [Marinilabiliaceae bacterium]|nr:universal stress protein [Marinilabiliaceae bacterium]